MAASLAGGHGRAAATRGPGRDSPAAPASALQGSRLAREKRGRRGKGQAGWVKHERVTAEPLGRQPPVDRRSHTARAGGHAETTPRERAGSRGAGEGPAVPVLGPAPARLCNRGELPLACRPEGRGHARGAGQSRRRKVRGGTARASRRRWGDWECGAACAGTSDGPASGSGAAGARCGGCARRGLLCSRLCSVLPLRVAEAPSGAGLDPSFPTRPAQLFSRCAVSRTPDRPGPGKRRRRTREPGREARGGGRPGRASDSRRSGRGAEGRRGLGRAGLQPWGWVCPRMAVESWDRAAEPTWAPCSGWLQSVSPFPGSPASE
jgi:hypothetical protein